MNLKPAVNTKYDALLIVANSELDSDLLYATRFFVPDPVIYFQIKNRSYLVLSDLEIDRAKKTATVDYVLSSSAISNRFKKKVGETGTVEIIDHIFQKRNIKTILVPANFPVELAEGLRKKKYKINIKSSPFFNSRQFKSDIEVKHIKDSLRATEKGMDAGIKLIRKSTIGKDGYLYSGNARLTSEIVRAEIDSTIIKMGYLPSHTIVSSGGQCCDPHNEGSGPLKANSSIILDIFPRSLKKGYFGDMTRTVVKGKATERLKKAYQTVFEGQQIAFDRIKDGVDGRDVHQAIQDFFKKKGFPTRKGKKRMEGFFHGTGHGLGLDVHEYPRISITSCTLKVGHVVTVEPGLYYPGIGGVRIEDVILVSKSGIKILSKYPKFFEIS